MVPEKILRPILTVVFVGLIVFAWWAGRRPDAAPAQAGSTFGFHLQEVAHSVGIDFTHHPAQFDASIENIMPHIAGVGAAVSIIDADGDGRLDLYATTNAFGTTNGLFVQGPDGRFVDRAREANLAELNVPGRGASMGSIWADYDGDGDLDCFVYRYGFPALMRNDGGLHFTDVTEAAGLEHWMNSNAATWIDYDRDGLVDLYVCGYFRDDVDLWHLETTKIMTESFEFAQNGGHKRLYKNLGDGRFVDVTAEMGCDSTRWTLAVAAADFDDDGWPDLYLANDYGVEELFLNEGGKHFARARDVGLDESSKSGMCVAVGDFANEGQLGVYVTNISKRGYLFQGNNLRLNRLAKSHVLQNMSEGVVADCGWAWGAQFGDLDDDGLADLFVVNGFRSANKQRDYWYGMGKIAVATEKLAEDARYWPPMEDRSLSGYERSRVLVNQGRARFVDAAEAVGADDLLDGRAVALGSLWNGPALDVVVANQDGALLVYKNTVDPGRHWIRLRLRGKAPNTAAIGARATLVRGASRQAQTVLAGSGFCAQNDLALHFGLGNATTYDEIVIRWPSGVEQHVTALPIDAENELREP